MDMFTVNNEVNSKILKIEDKDKGNKDECAKGMNMFTVYNDERL